MIPARAGGRAVDLEGPSVYQGGPKFESTKTAVFKRVSLFIGVPRMSIGGARPPLAPALIPAIAAEVTTMLSL